MKRFWQWLLVVVLSAAVPAHADDGPVIAAASDLKFALDEIVAEFRKGTGQSVRVSYGSSGNFFRQIAQDAPFELFLSA
jgi:molybdate transport system substrate-binding protein